MVRQRQPNSTLYCGATLTTTRTNWKFFYTNIEGEAINRIYQAVDEGCDGLVMNPAGFTYAGFALKDCIKGAGLPYVEAHISSIAKRNIHCVLSDVGRRDDYRLRDSLLHLGFHILRGGDRTGCLAMQSAANQSPHPLPLLTGKLTGNFANSGTPKRFSLPNQQAASATCGQIP